MNPTNRPNHARTATVLVAAALLAFAAPFALPATAATSGGPDHLVIVVMENRDRTEVIGNTAAPYENLLASQGVDYANAQGKTHPSLGNYLTLYSGSTQGQDGKDACIRSTADNLGRQAAANGVSLKVFVEGLGTGNPLVDNGLYACRHNPAAQFNDAANNAASLDLGAFPTDFTQLPRISFVIPNLCNDTHDCGVPIGDSWLKTHMDAYVQWAKAHNSVLVVTWDENHHAAPDYTTPMPTFVVGAGVTHSVQTARVSQEAMLRTIVDWFGLPRLAGSAYVGPLPGLPNYGAVTPPPTGTFAATFAPTAAVNAWWVEFRVTSASAIASVSATVNGGAPHALAKTAWGTYAASFAAPAGSAVVATAKDTGGRTATSATYAWLGAAPPTPSGFTATFAPRAVGNDWWVEVAVTSAQGIGKVEASLNGGAFTQLPKTSWGTYAKSLNAPNGAQVVFRATSTTGATATSAAMTWT